MQERALTLFNTNSIGYCMHTTGYKEKILMKLKSSV